MKTVTYEEFLRFDPCWLNDGRAEKLAKIGARKKDWSALDILKLRGVSDEDKLWAVLREELIDAPLLHEFACRCAERALTNAKVEDKRSWDAIAAKRAWLRGEMTDEQLAKASATAWDAAWATRAASDAASDAAWDAAWDAARAAARDAERKWQVAELKKMLEVAK